MYRSNSSRTFTTILILIVVVALVIGIVLVAKNLFFNGSDTTDTVTAEQAARENLLSLDVDRSVRMTVRGPIVANEEFRTTQITVSPTSRQYTLYDGYLDNVKNQQSWSNNSKAYEEFVYALDKADFTAKGKYTEEQASDVRGICATGRVYEYELLNDGSVTNRFWTSTCKGSPGTFGASVEQVTNLFVSQIPEEDAKALDID